jgi:hypothetical protein
MKGLPEWNFVWGDFKGYGKHVAYFIALRTSLAER